MIKERDIRFDIIKGILIILVVLGHSLNIEFKENSWNCILFNAIYCFHMPLFIFISGYFFHSCLNRSFQDVFVSKFKRLIIPALLFSTILFGIYLLSPLHAEEGFSLKRIVLSYISYWYLINIFFLSLIYWVFVKKGAFAKAIIIFGYIFGLYSYYRFPVVMAIDCQIVRMFICFGLGVIFHSYKACIKRRQTTCILLLSIALVILDRYYYGTDLTKYPPMLRILDGLAFCVISFVFLYKIVDLLPGMVKNFLSYNGLNTLPIYLIHLLLYNGCLYFNLKIPEGSYYSLIAFLIIYTITLFVTFVLNKNIKNSHKYLIGL